MNRKGVARFPSISSDPELAYSFKNFFADRIDSIRAHMISEKPPATLEICCDDNPHEFTNFRPVSSKKISDLITFQVKSCDLDPVPALY